MNRSTLARLSAALVCLGLTSLAHAQTKWDLPSAYAPANFHTENLEFFAKEVDTATAGKLKINVPDTDDFPSGTDSPIVFTISVDKITEGFNLREYELDGDEFEDE